MAGETKREVSLSSSVADGKEAKTPALTSTSVAIPGATTTTSIPIPATPDVSSTVSVLPSALSLTLTGRRHARKLSRWVYEGLEHLKNCEYNEFYKMLDYNYDRLKDRGYLGEHAQATIHFIQFLIRSRAQRIRRGETAADHEGFGDVFYMISDISQLNIAAKAIPLDGIILMERETGLTAFLIENGEFIRGKNKNPHILRLEIRLSPRQKKVFEGVSGKIEPTAENRSLLRGIKFKCEGYFEKDPEAKAHEAEIRIMRGFAKHEEVLKNLISKHIGRNKNISCDEAILVFQAYLRDLEDLSVADDEKEDQEVDELAKNVEKAKIKKYRSRLLIGEAGFSYTRAVLLKNSANNPALAASFTATEYMSYEAMQRVHGAIFERTVSDLKESGVTVICGVDGTKIHTNPTLMHNRYKRIHFNFPFNKGTFTNGLLARLVSEFFQSAALMQNENDEIHMAFPHPPIKKFGGRWFRQAHMYKIFEASAGAGYVLVKKRRFGTERYPGYEHVITGSSSSAPIAEEAREFIFQKTNLSPEAIRNHETYGPGGHSLAYSENLPYLKELPTDSDSSNYEDSSDEDVIEVKAALSDHKPEREGKQSDGELKRSAQSSSSNSSSSSKDHPAGNSHTNSLSSNPSRVAPSSIPRVSLYRPADKYASEIKAALLKDYDEGAARTKGDCFFDSVAQELERLGKPISGDAKHEAYKKLRVLCHSYIHRHDQLPSDQNWLKAAIDDDSTNEGGATYQACLAIGQYTQPEMEQMDHQAKGTHCTFRMMRILPSKSMGLKSCYVYVNDERDTTNQGLYYFNNKGDHEAVYIPDDKVEKFRADLIIKMGGNSVSNQPLSHADIEKLFKDNECARLDGFYGGLSTWGRPTIEGRIICELFKVKLHVIRFYEGKPFHMMVDPNATPIVQSVSERDIDLTSTDIIHIANNQEHFVPIFSRRITIGQVNIPLFPGSQTALAPSPMEVKARSASLTQLITPTRAGAAISGSNSSPSVSGSSLSLGENLGRSLSPITSSSNSAAVAADNVAEDTEMEFSPIESPNP